MAIKNLTFYSGLNEKNLLMYDFVYFYVCYGKNKGDALKNEILLKNKFPKCMYTRIFISSKLQEIAAAIFYN